MTVYSAVIDNACSPARGISRLGDQLRRSAI